MRTLDAQYLQNNPPGDERADFTFSANVPDSAGLSLNPDGTKPQVSVKVNADTFMAGLVLLGQLHDDPDELLTTWLGRQLSAAQFRKAVKMIGKGQRPDFAVEAMKKVHPEFLTFNSSASFTMQVNGAEVEQTVDLTITAPSIEIGIQGFVSLTSAARLQNAAIGFCPEIEDGYGDSNEVMLIA